MRGGAEAARRAHNPKVPGSNPGPATEKFETVDKVCGFFITPSKGTGDHESIHRSCK